MIVTFTYDWVGLPLDCTGEYFPAQPGSRDCPPETECFDLHSVSHCGQEVPVFDTAIRHINRDGSTSWWELAELIIEAGMEEAEAQRRFDLEDEAACMGQARKDLIEGNYYV